MADTYRVPAVVLAETDLPASINLADVLALRDADGETGAWARRIADDLIARAVTIEEAATVAANKRAEGADIPLSDALALLLGDTFEFATRAHEAHWNVSGPDFTEWHALFGDIYDDAHGSIDPLAENLRKIGSLTPSLCVMPTEVRHTDPVPLATELLDEAVEMAEACRMVFDIATAAGQQGIANFLADRQDSFAKWAWMLRSSLGVAEVGESPAVDAIHAEEMGEVEADEVETNSADPETEERRSLIAEAEKRTFSVEVRAEQVDGMVRMSGYAAMFDREADGLPFREVIARGAFSRSLDRGDDVFLLVNHDTDQLPLARRSAGTLEVTEDEIGLRVEAMLDPANPRAAELASALERGDVDKMSFAFSVAKDGSAKRSDGVRELRDLNLYEVSIVTWPAYSATTVGLRSADDDLALRWKRAALRLAQRDL